MKRLLSASILVLLSQALPLRAVELPAITHYGLNVELSLTEQRVRVLANLTITNNTRAACARIPFLLYRLLAVQHINDRSGQPLDFTQQIIQLSDVPSLQAREAVLHLPTPLQPGDSISITMTYSGFVFGYPEVMAYVNDKIDENYTLLRPDALSFPVVAESTFTSIFAASDTRFTYELSATVPKGYTAACGGELLGRNAGAGGETFAFRSKIPTWRIDLAVARFSVLGDSAHKLLIYHLPNDSTGARRILDASRNAVHLYSRMFGSPKHQNGYTIIEIPEGWGSQASDFYFLQTAAAFTDSSRIGEVYHELGHSWNARPSRDIQRCRYFDEAFASFFEPLAIRSFRGEQAFEESMEKSRAAFGRRANQNREVFDTPIADYGKRELGRHSYTKGAWSLYVLWTLVGEKTFNSIIRTMLTEFDGRTINFREFQSLCENISKRSLDRFFQEWIYRTESSRLMVEKVPIAEIVKRY